MVFGRRGRRRSLITTLLVAFIYGAFSSAFVINQSAASLLYDRDYLSFCVLAPLGAFCGFLVFGGVHELTELLAARCAGFYVRSLVLGAGTIIAKFYFLGIPFVIGESLLGGKVHYLVTTQRHARLKMFLVTSAAVAAPLALTAALFFLARATFPLDPATTSLERRLYAFLLGMTAVTILSLPGILIPYAYRHGGMWIRSDTMQLLTLPWRSDAEIQKQVLAAETLMHGEIDPMTFSAQEAETKVAANPDNSIALRTAIMFLRQDADPKLQDYYQRLIALASTSAERQRCIDEYLTYCLESDTVAANAPEMDALSAELLASDPNSLSLRGTRGGILVDLGRHDQGVAMLTDVLARSENAVDQSYSSIFVALAAKAAGDVETAREYARHALKADSECPALKRVADLLEPAIERKS